MVRQRRVVHARRRRDDAPPEQVVDPGGAGPRRGTSPRSRARAGRWRGGPGARRGRGRRLTTTGPSTPYGAGEVAQLDEVPAGDEREVRGHDGGRPRAGRRRGRRRAGCGARRAPTPRGAGTRAAAGPGAGRARQRQQTPQSVTRQRGRRARRRRRRRGRPVAGARCRRWPRRPGPAPGPRRGGIPCRRGRRSGARPRRSPLAATAARSAPSERGLRPVDLRQARGRRRRGPRDGVGEALQRRPRPVAVAAPCKHVPGPQAHPRQGALPGFGRCDQLGVPPSE